MTLEHDESRRGFEKAKEEVKKTSQIKIFTTYF